MSDSEDESITRQKKPLSEARLAAIEKMKEGRKRSLEAKKKAKEEEKEAKKEIKKKIKMKVEEELNGLSSLPLDDKEIMETLKQNAINPSMNGFTEDIKIMPAEQQTEPESEEEVIEIKQPIKRKPKKKKKIVVNNYYEDESSEEEEIVNNYHKKNKKKKVVIESSSDDEILYDAPEEKYEPPQLVRQRTYIPNAMEGISFR
jgi:endo-alpha-1,4-polygalactosaminidase (GH114 family)